MARQDAVAARPAVSADLRQCISLCQPFDDADMGKEIGQSPLTCLPSVARGRHPWTPASVHRVRCQKWQHTSNLAMAVKSSLNVSLSDKVKSCRQKLVHPDWRQLSLIKP